MKITNMNSVLKKMRLAAQRGDCELVMRHYLAVIVQNLVTKPELMENPTPRTLIDIVEALNALKRLELIGRGAASRDEPADAELLNFKKRLSLVSGKTV